MKKAESVGSFIGSIIGAIGTGFAVYFTGSTWSCLIGLFGYLIGSQIGKEIGKTSD